MIYLIGGAVPLAGGFALLIRRYRHLASCELKRLMQDFRADVLDICRDTVSCFIHTVLGYAILRLLGLPGAQALGFAFTVGAIKLFASDNMHPTGYLHRTRRRLGKRWSRRDSD